MKSFRLQTGIETHARRIEAATMHRLCRVLFIRVITRVHCTHTRAQKKTVQPSRAGASSGACGECTFPKSIPKLCQSPERPGRFLLPFSRWLKTARLINFQLLAPLVESWPLADIFSVYSPLLNSFSCVLCPLLCPVAHVCLCRLYIYMYMRLLICPQPTNVTSLIIRPQSIVLRLSNNFIYRCLDVELFN